MSVDVAIGILGTQVIIHTYLTVAILARRNGEIGVVDDAVLGPGADDLDRDTVAVDVVEVGPGVALDDKGRFRPVLTVRDLVDPPA
jgi:hypothetical protein